MSLAKFQDPAINIVQARGTAIVHVADNLFNHIRMDSFKPHTTGLMFHNFFHWKKRTTDRMLKIRNVLVCFIHKKLVHNSGHFSWFGMNIHVITMITS